MHYRKDVEPCITFKNQYHELVVMERVVDLVLDAIWDKKHAVHEQAGMLMVVGPEAKEKPEKDSRTRKYPHHTCAIDLSIYSGLQWKTPFSHKPDKHEQIPVDDKNHLPALSEFSVEQKAAYIWQGMPLASLDRATMHVPLP